MESLDASRRPEIEPLLLTAENAVRNGHQSIARTLFRAIVREFPADPRGWRGLAGIAASPNDAYDALEQAFALDPNHGPTRERLEQLASQLGVVPPSAPQAAPPAAPFENEEFVAALNLDPDTAAEAAAVPQMRPPFDQFDAQEQLESPRFPLMNRIAVVTIVVLIAVIGWLIGRALFSDNGASPEPILQSSGDPAFIVPLDTPVSTAPALGVTDLPIAASPIVELPTLEAVEPTLEPVVSTAPILTPDNGALPLGTVASVDDWNVTLLRPEYAQLLDGGIGDLRPQGRFVLALVAISNESTAPRRIPADLFTIVDQQGRVVTPAPAASTVFLNTFGRGQYGDLALEDEIAAQSGMRTVPLIFDVPLDASGLLLQAGDAAWPIEGASTQPAGP